MNGGWRIETDGEDMQARFVVIATGFDHDPDLPGLAWARRLQRRAHPLQRYRNPEPYQGVTYSSLGPGVTGSEVAALLSQGGAGRVRVACRTPPNLTARKFLGVSVNIHGLALDAFRYALADQLGWWTQRMLFGKLDRYGLPRSPVGVATQSRRQQAPAYDSGFVGLLKAGRIEIVAALVGFDGPDVLLADDTRIQPDAVIAATGYRRGLEPLVGHLGVLDEDGTPLVSGGTSTPRRRDCSSTATGRTSAASCGSCDPTPARSRGR